MVKGIEQNHKKIEKCGYCYGKGRNKVKQDTITAQEKECHIIIGKKKESKARY